MVRPSEWRRRAEIREEHEVAIRSTGKSACATKTKRFLALGHWLLAWCLKLHSPFRIRNHVSNTMKTHSRGRLCHTGLVKPKF
jgi:hypothetical protein